MFRFNIRDTKDNPLNDGNRFDSRNLEEEAVPMEEKPLDSFPSSFSLQFSPSSRLCTL
jgi:hypothetical protein